MTPAPYSLKEMKMRMTKLLALVALAVVAVACNGISPTAPSPAIRSDETSALAGATAEKSPAPAPDFGCRDITKVELRRLRSEPGFAMVEAVYLNHTIPVRCDRTPEWSSRPRGRLRPTWNPFIVAVILTSPPSTVQVTAKAPNGVTGSILVR